MSDDGKIRGHRSLDKHLNDVADALIADGQRAVFILTFDGTFHLKSRGKDVAGTLLADRLYTWCSEAVEKKIDSEKKDGRDADSQVDDSRKDVGA